MRVSLPRALQRLPDVVAQAVEDLHTLLATQQIERGRAVMRALVSAVTLHPVAGGGLEAEVCGDLRGTLALAGPKASQTVQLMWLGIIRDLRTALLKDPIPAEVVKELLAA